MSAALRPYTHYRQTDVPWLPRVPACWEMRRLKTLLKRNDSGAWGSGFDDHGTIVLRSTEQTISGNWRVSNPARRILAEQEQKNTLLEAGDLLVTKSSGSPAHIGKTTLVDAEIAQLRAGFSNFMQRLRTKPDLSSEFAWYVLNSRLSREQFAFQSTSTTGLGNLTASTLGNLWLAVPPIEEQRLVARYCAHLDARVNRLLRAKRRLIALLTEQKQAIIQQAVTRGLDPDTPMKPSGVAWLGESPAHWHIRRNGSLFSLRREEGVPTLPILEVSLRSGVTVRNLDQAAGARKQMMADLTGYQIARKDDIAYNVMRMWQGAAGLVPIDGLVSPAYVVLRPRPGADSAYYALLYRTRPFMTEVDRWSRGIVKDRNRLYWADYKQMAVPVPPVDEQRRIVEFLEQEIATLDAAVDRITREIDLIREYWTRLVADVVTGQLDVRAAAAAFPDIDPLDAAGDDGGADLDDLSDSEIDAHDDALADEMPDAAD